MSLASCGLFLGLVMGFYPHGAHAAEVTPNQDTLNKSLRQEAIAGVIPRIERLIQAGADIQSKAPHGETALEYAIRFGRFGAALRLIQLGANPNSENDSGMTPLHWAAKEPNASRVVQALLRAGANVNRRDIYGNTALINAAQADCVRTVAVLLSAAQDKVDLDAQNDQQQSAASVAREGRVLQMLEAARKQRQGGGAVDLSVELAPRGRD